MTVDRQVVFVVDDDSRVREALSSLLASAGLEVAVFASATEFLNADKPDAPACLVLDLELPDINGLELQKELAEREAPPIVCFAHTVPLAPPFLVDPFPGFRAEILLMKLNESRKTCAHDGEATMGPWSHGSRNVGPGGTGDRA